ncbi:MAG: ECF-type sigma factor [Pirellulales bacterium]|nr:ECF-type sigma factor [Pirellulales bacterium]
MDGDLNTRLQQACQGDEAAALEIWNAYYDRLVSYASRKMRGMPRRATDEEDVALSAFGSFFKGARAGRLAPKDTNELWKLLATITVRKATAQQRRHFADKRGGGRVRGGSGFDANQIVASDDDLLSGLSPHLGAACEELLACLGDSTLQRVALLRLASYTNDEIAAELNCGVATIKRRVAEIRSIWSTIRQEDR